MRTLMVLLITFTMVIAPLLPTGGSTTEDEHSSEPSPSIAGQELTDARDLLSMTPTAFTENRGQVPDHVRFYVQGGGLWFTEDGVWFDIREEAEADVRPDPFDPFEPDIDPEPVRRRGVVLKQEFVGCNEVEPEGVEYAGWNSNYFYGNDPEGWRSDVPNWKEVWYRDLWDGIDLRYYTNERGLKYDLIVRPGADVGDIRLRYRGADSLRIDGGGDLRIVTSSGDITDGDLFIYQRIDGETRQVAGRFSLYEGGEVGFELATPWVADEVLVIDPTLGPCLDFCTYIGGSGGHIGRSVGADNEGNCYILGQTSSWDFPTTTGAYNTTFVGIMVGVVVKMDPQGSSLVYSTYIGGSYSNWPQNMEVDASGSVRISGQTLSSDYPTTPGVLLPSCPSSFVNGFITRLSPGGDDLVFSTYFGGYSNDYLTGMDVDGAGNVYVTGSTFSGDFPVTSGAYCTVNNTFPDGFVSKLKSDGSALVYSTFVGGGLVDWPTQVAVDLAGDAYVTGYTCSDDFPTTPGVLDNTYAGSGANDWDGFLLRLSSSGSSLKYSTYIGGSAWDLPYSISVDAPGNAYITGHTNSSDFPTTPGSYNSTFVGTDNSTFVCKVNPTASSLVYSTFIGHGYAYSLTVDIHGSAFFVAGAGPSYPSTPGALDATHNGGIDVAVGRLTPDGSDLDYSTFIGGTDDDYATDIFLLSANTVLITGETKSNETEQFPVTPGAFDTTFNCTIDHYDIFALRHRIGSHSASAGLLLNGSVNDTIYAEYAPYTFRVNISRADDLDDIEAVELALDPGGTNIVLRWDRASGAFHEVTDVGDAVRLEADSSYGNNSWDRWLIDFNITMDWTYPDELPHGISVCVLSASLPDVWYNVTDLYRVENDLDFAGQLEVADGGDNALPGGSLIRGGEPLTFTGLTPVYEGTTDIHPPQGEYNVSVYDEFGHHYGDDSPVRGHEFSVQFPAPNVTYGDGLTFVVNITGLPPGVEVPEVTYELHIDAWNVTFTDPVPDNATWQTSNEVEAGITIADVGGAIVDGDSIHIATSADNGTTWADWTDVPYPHSRSVEARAPVTLEDGRDNLVKWRASDTLGNGPAESPAYGILVDTEGPSFHNAHPPNTAVSGSREQSVGIDILDTVSGVDDTSIEYGISDDGGRTWAEWKSATGVKDGKYIHSELDLVFPNGTRNRVKWRASDIAGNSAESGPYIVNVDIWKDRPRVRLKSPLNETVFEAGDDVGLAWALAPGSAPAANYSVFMGYCGGPLSIHQADATETTLPLTGSEAGTYQWTIIPYSASGVEGICIDGIWTFDVVVLPCLDFDIAVDPVDPVEMLAGEVRHINVTVWNYGMYADRIGFVLGSGELAHRAYITEKKEVSVDSGGSVQVDVTIDLSERNTPAGTYPISFTAISKEAELAGCDVRANTTFVVTLPSEPYEPPPDGGGGDGGEVSEDDDRVGKGAVVITVAIVAILMVVIAVVLLLVAMLKKRKKAPEEDAPPAPVATPIITPSSAVEGDGPPRALPAVAADSGPKFDEPHVPVAHPAMPVGSVEEGEEAG